MSDLAYNINGESFEVPAAVHGWRVRRMKQRGAPEVVYGRDGVPLVVPIESDLEELRRNVDEPGRFRLDAVDERGRTIEDVPAAYVMVSTRPEAIAAPQAGTSGIGYQTPDSVVAEAMRLNTELAKSVIDRFPEMMHAAAELLRAADGAGLPARQPRAIDSDDDDDDDDEDEPQAPASSPTFELINTLVAQVVPLLVTGFANKKVPKLGAIVDWRKAVPESTAVVTETEARTSEPASEEAALPPLDPKAMSHFIAIQSALTPAEAALARQVAAELSPTEMRVWFAELTALSVPDAVARIRSFVGTAAKGGAS